MPTRSDYHAGAQLGESRKFIAAALHDASRALPLSLQLFRGTLRAQQRRALLGRLWLFLPAFAAATAASYVQAQGIIRVETPEMPYPVFVFAGTVLWQCFLDALNAPLTQLTTNRALITRMRFPHEGLILAGMWLGFLNAAIRLLSLLMLCWVSGVAIAPSALMIPGGVIMLSILGLALGMCIAPFALLYDDIGRAIAMATSFAVFVMPVAYPIARSGWQRLNPLLPVIETTRSWLVGGAGPGFCGAPALGAMLLFGAWPLYRLALPHVLARLG